MRLLLIAGVTLAAAGAPEMAGAGMSRYTWKQRPLLVFATDAASEELAGQKRIVEGNRGGLRERDIVVIYVVGDTVVAEGGALPGESAASLRSRYGIARKAFKVVLVGKDGGEKLVSATPLAAERLFGNVDQMPMRRDEMRTR